MGNMAGDDTFRVDDPVGGRPARKIDSMEFLDDTYDEMRIKLRARGAVRAQIQPFESDENVRELRVARYDHAAARCGRWGDEGWR